MVVAEWHGSEMRCLVQVPSAGGSGKSSAAVGGSQQSAPPSGVINLGVVGRGSKRINLQPVSAAAAPSTGIPLAQPCVFSVLLKSGADRCTADGA